VAELEHRHQLEVTELRGKVKFLINKIESQEETVSKPSLGAISAISSEMIQSKMVQSSSSVDSFRLAPASLSCKDSLTRRNTSGVKTPSKYGGTYRQPRNPLGDRNY
jgi:hypothetical protein